MDLSVRYMGLNLINPLVASPSPFCEHLDKIEQMVSAGASAIVLHSLFEEQLRTESEGLNRNLTAGTESFAEALSYRAESQSTLPGRSATGGQAGDGYPVV